MSTPNVLYILADDLGWDDVSCHGSPIRTPNIDRLVQGGVELTQHYVCPMCTPTRTSLLTGRHPGRFGPHATVPSNAPRPPPTTTPPWPPCCATRDTTRGCSGSGTSVQRRSSAPRPTASTPATAAWRAALTHITIATSGASSPSPGTAMAS